MNSIKNDIVANGASEKVTENQASSIILKKRAAFFATSAVSLAMSATVYAATVTVPAGPVTEAVVDAQVAANPDADITLDIKTGAVVTGPGGGDVDIISAGPVNSGAVTVLNGGSIGAVTAGVITNDTGLNVIGVNKVDAKNTATITNSGLITGGISVGQMGGNVSVTNNGAVHQGIFAASFGNTTVTTGTTGSVVSGQVTAVALSDAKTTTVGGVNTTVATGGDVKIVQQGAAASADGLTKVDIFGNSLVGSTDITVSKVAGNVTAVASLNFSKIVNGGDAPVAGKTVTTFINEQTFATGKANVTIENGADVNGVSVFGAGGGTVVIDGKANSLNQQTLGVANTSTTNTQTLAADGKTTQFAGASTSNPAGGNQILKIGETGVVTNSVAVSSNGGNSDVTVNGAIGSTLNVNDAGATKSGNSFVQNLSPTTGLTTDNTNSNFTSAAGGSIALAVGSKGAVTGAVTLATNAGAVNATVDGKLGSNLSATSNGSNVTNSGSQKFDVAGKQLQTTGAFSNTQVGGAVTGTIGSTGSVTNTATFFSGAGAVQATVSGSVGGNLNLTSAGTKSTFSSEDNFDPTTFALANSTTKNTAGTTGSTATAAINKGGVVKGTINAVADGGVTITNAGTVGNGINATSRVTATTSSSNSNVFTSKVSATLNESSNTNTNQFKQESLGGKIAITNDANGLISGNTSANSVGDITYSNSGAVRGQTSLNSSGTFNEGSTTTFTSSSTVITPAPTDKTTTVNKLDQISSQGSNGGSVTGTYAGANGTLNFAPAADGSVFQSANKDSTATVSGSIFGNLNSDAGTGFATKGTFSQNSTTVLDTTGKGTKTGGQSNLNQYTDGPGTSTVNITGVVGAGNVGSAANVVSTGGTGSKVTLTNGLVEGSVTSNSDIFASSDESVNSYAQNFTAFAPTTTTATDTTKSSSTQSGGASSVELAGTSKVNGSVNVTGVQSASVRVDTAARVGGSVFASTNFGDTTGETSRTYTRDATTGVVAASEITKSSNGAAAASGNSSADIAGTVAGTVNVNANRGNATVSVTGSSGGVNANASFADGTSSTQRDFAGKAAAGSSTNAFGNVIPALTKQSTSNTTTPTGGRATVTVDTSAANQSLGVGGVNGTVNANGVGGATIAVTAGSKITGNANATSSSTANKTDSVEVFGAIRTLDSTNANTLVGADASITNAGTISGAATANGRTAATVANTGKIGNGANAFSIGTNSTVVVTDTNIDNVALRNQVTKTTRTTVGGDAKITNAVGGIISGSASAAGITGSINNSGAVTGALVVGTAVNNLTETVTRTATTTTSKLEPVTLATQTYTVDNNGTASGVVVQGATVSFTPAGATAPQTFKTSDIKATVNLNNGSATLGNIDAQRDALTGAFLTSTTVNLNGAGFLGADFVSNTAPTTPARTPVLVLSKDAQTAGFGTGNSLVRVTGVTTLNKTGAGTFVINGARYIAPTAPGLLPGWTLDVGTFNISAGEVQLNTDTAAGSQFGIKGNVVNNSTLVIGRRVPTPVLAVGDSLVGSGTETIAGINVRQTGNFTQGATGNLVVGINPSLTRFGQTTIGTSGSAPELFGAVGAGVTIPFFTTPAKAGNANVPSRWDITGDLNLAGKVTTDINRNSLFSNGDGYTLFTYTGAGTVTATVDTSITSRFVSIALKHDAAAKTVALTASRASYTTGATNPNAVNAAASLDTALTTVINRIRTDAAGGSGFVSATEIGRSQDIANIASGLDWRLNQAQAAQVFNELSSGEFYGSLSAVDQNLAFGRSAELLAGRRAAGQDLKTSIWLNPVGHLAKYGDITAGNSPIRVNSYGGAGGFDFAYSATGAFGLGVGYTQHDASARGTAEEGRGRTYTIGAYFSQGFGPIYANGAFAVGFSKFDTERNLALLARTISADFKGKQLDASLEVGYDFAVGGNFVLTPFGELAIRRWSFDSFTEEAGGGIALSVDKASKSVLNPTLGVKFTGTLAANSSGFQVRPYGKLAYTFQGDINSERNVRFVGGGNDFTLRGVHPDAYGQAELGLDASLNNRLNVFFGGGFTFGGHNKSQQVQGGVSMKF